MIGELYERCFAAAPTPDELNKLVSLVPQDADGKRQALEDVFWALLNSEEFMFNH